MRYTASKQTVLAGAAMLLSLAVVGSVAMVSLWAVRIPDFAAIDSVQARKQTFFNYMLPIVLEVNTRIIEDRASLERIAEDLEAGRELDVFDRLWLARLANRYRLDSDSDPEELVERLLPRVDIVPPSLALAQGAIESSWGRSRFARQANNFFGIWCYRPECGLVPGRRERGKTHEVQRFASPEESLVRYVRTLNTASFYAPLRRIREQLREAGKTVTGAALAAGLKRYSERGDAYISDVRSVIRTNELSRLDHALAAD